MKPLGNTIKSNYGAILFIFHFHGMWLAVFQYACGSLGLLQRWTWAQTENWPWGTQSHSDNMALCPNTRLLPTMDATNWMFMSSPSSQVKAHRPHDGLRRWFGHDEPSPMGLTTLQRYSLAFAPCEVTVKDGRVGRCLCRKVPMYSQTPKRPVPDLRVPSVQKCDRYMFAVSHPACYGSPRGLKQ